MCGAAFGRCQASCTGEGFKKEHNELEKTWLPVKQNQEQAGKYPPERESERKKGQKKKRVSPSDALRVFATANSLSTMSE